MQLRKSSEHLVVWVKLSAILSLIFGLIGVASLQSNSYYWYKGVMGLAGVISSLLSMQAARSGTYVSAVLNYYSLATFVLLSIIGNLVVLIFAEPLADGYCAAHYSATEDKSCEIAQSHLRNQSFIILCLLVIIWLPLVYFAGKYMNAMEKEIGRTKYSEHGMEFDSFV